MVRRSKTSSKSEADNVDLTVDLPGLVHIFGDALYKDFGSIVRELTQNAHDAIISLLAKHPHPEQEIRSRSINIFFDSSDRSLVIADNGSGMDREEIAKNLNNFARSQKRDLTQSISETFAHDSAIRLMNIIGEYGVGFLSAMAVSDTVGVYSKASSRQPVRWTYNRGQSTAAIAEISLQEFQRIADQYSHPDAETGTIVVCCIRGDTLDEYGIDESDVRTSIIKYTALLLVPVSFNGEPISCRFSAWENPEAATGAEWMEAIRGMHDQEPLLVIPIYSPPGQLDLQGVLWIPERTRMLAGARLDLYVKRLFVLDDDGIVIPSWATFISGMINSNKIRRIVSGNTIKVDRHSRDSRDFLKDRIIDEFRKLRSRSIHDYWRIVGPHDDAIKGSAADDSEFRECIWDKLRFPTGDRRLTIPDYLALVKRKTGNDNVIFVYDETKQMHSADLVSDATGIPVIDLTQARDDAVIRRICSDRDFELRSFRELAEKHFQKPEGDSPYDSLVAACAHWNIDAEVRQFAPDYLPAVLIEDETFQQRRQRLIEGLREHGDEHFARDLEKLFRKQHAANFGVSFYLNSRNDLIRELVNADFERQSRMCLALYNISFMAAVPNLTDTERGKIYKSISGVLIEGLDSRNGHIEEVAQKSRGGRGRAKKEDRTAVATRAMTMFMITPFDDEYKNVEAAVRKVFEGPPYYFKVLLARDHTYHSSLLENVRVHIDSADAFIAEITDLNPNVMLELGAVLLAGVNKPVFSLRGRDAKREVPSDIKSELYIPYGKASDEVDIIVRDLKIAIERDGRPSHAAIVGLLEARTRRAMTRTLLDQLGMRLTSTEVDDVLRNFESVEDFMRAPKEKIAELTRLKQYAIEALRGELSERG